MEEPISASYFNIFANETDVSEYAPGDDVFRAGDPADCLYVIRSGRVRIHADGRELETLEPGAIFGEMALVDGSPRSATATAVDAVTLVSLDEHRFQMLVQKTPYFVQEVMRVMAKRLRRSTEA